MKGSLSVLNTGAGDIVFTFNKFNDKERDDALKMLLDMRQRGYAILIRMPDDTYVRAVDIDAERGQYVIQMPAGGVEAAGEGAVAETPKKKGRHGGRRARVPIGVSHAVGVARSAGG